MASEQPAVTPESGPGVSRQPSIIVFDVNETLSDMSPMAARFSDVGLEAHLAATWFAGLLRDGFALTVTGANPSFADLAKDALRGVLEGAGRDVDEAVSHIMAGFAELPVHPDVVGGIRALRDQGLRLVTLSNGATSVAQGLFERNGIDDCFERLLSVEDARAWKPAASAYAYALEVCDVTAAEAMLVAVHPWDIHGAREAGLATAWINRSGARYPQMLRRADLEVDSVTELADVLSSGSSH
jgi:2-haloacid dehalogenase